MLVAMAIGFLVGEIGIKKSYKPTTAVYGEYRLFSKTV